MSNQRQAMAAYQAAIRTTPPLKAVVMLYDRILYHIAGATAAARRRDYEAQFDEVMRAARIVDGLNRYLDMDKGARVAISLSEMYEAVSRALLSSVGRSTGPAALDKIAGGVRKTRDAWAEISGMRASTPASADAAAALQRPAPRSGGEARGVEARGVEAGGVDAHPAPIREPAADRVVAGRLPDIRAALDRATFGA